MNWSMLEPNNFGLDFDRDKVFCGLLGNVCPVYQLPTSLFILTGSLFLVLTVVLTIPFWVPIFLMSQVTTWAFFFAIMFVDFDDDDL